MTSRYQHINDSLSGIDAAIKFAATHVDDPQMAAYLSMFLVVRVSGIYEECVEYLLCERAARAQDEQILAFVKTTLHQTFRNPDFDNLVTLVARFSEDYSRKLKTRVDY